MKAAVWAKSVGFLVYIGVILVPIVISEVSSAIAWHKAKLSPKLGPKIPENPLASISFASWIVFFLRPGTAARLIAGKRVMIFHP
jgi:hypothetical protein|tara:strand:- start:342 stop:596 length:255 start_codon:yes stop_codon:yes gene_type:complete